MKNRLLVLVLVGALVAGLAAAYFMRRGTALPGPGSDAYEQVTRAFYHGVAALEVGLLDDAGEQFARAAELVPGEPASWANLGVTRLRLGELDAASAPIERAMALAPENARIVLLAGRMEIARGRLDQGIAHLRRAVALDPAGLRARFALADEIERAGGANADPDAQAMLDELARLAPDNLAVLIERARVAAKRGDADRLNESVTALGRFSSAWSPAAAEQYRALQKAAAAGDLVLAQRTTNLLRNTLAPVPVFRESLGSVRTPTELIAEPFEQFVVLTPPSATPSPADLAITFQAEALGAPADAPAGVLLAVPANEPGAPALYAADEGTLRRIDGVAGAWPFPGRVSANGVLALDWNHDFRTDIVTAGSGGLRLLLQGIDGTLADATPRAAGDLPVCDCFGAWAADVEMDGDLDIVAAPMDADPVVLRNNGNGTWMPVSKFSGVPGARAFGWADLDRDADPDAALVDMLGALHVFANRQAGNFARAREFPSVTGVMAMTVADLDADGGFDIITLGSSGSVRRISRRGEAWQSQEIAQWQGLNRAVPGSHRLLVADLDNNGALDLIATGASASRIWLSDERHQLRGLQTAPDGEVFSVADLNGDGRLDLAATAGAGGDRPESRAVRLLNRGTSNYHWKVVRARAQQNAGDQRINAFGVGGDIEVRSGLLVQKQVLTGAPVHIGLGAHSSIDVARIVWPNGVPQAEFGTGVDDTIVAEQRLKGSCPWVFAWDGRAMTFVTDFLWRSPLGLRINAQDTAGVTQTEDWVKIGGEQLVPANGQYDLRITAELWETHFFDHVSLLVVDHPSGTEIFVDERFSAAHPPALAVHAVRDMRAVAGAWDERGREVTDLVTRQDGRYLATFARGAYQGIAQAHFVELELPVDAPRSGRLTLLARGWIYPTDSSINVAIGQGGDIRPSGIALEAQDADGHWRVIDPDLGFPAGKHKTMLIDLTRAAGARRLRLRTNLEVYWDSLAVGVVVEAPLRTTRLPISRADLRYRGFSATTSPRGEAPETPLYARIANRSQRWRDLEGYHTRFGDVRELLSAVDDRYVIMNAGDELHMLFPEQPAPPSGWRRDFVLIGDGWEKDGDYNTGFSQTVLPLPSHDRPDYGSSAAPTTLEDDPVYRRHPEDWERYHTRFVTPERFVRGLRLR